MTTITRERIEQIYAECEERDPAIFEIRELARIALASLTAEPVAWTDADELRDANNGGSGYLFSIGGDANKFADPRRQLVLYTAPPAPVVPTFDEWLEVRGNKPLGWVKDAMRESYDACRDAMLQGKAEPVSNRDELSSPVIPDGYALVPKEPTEAMLLLLGLTGSFTAMDAAYQKMLAASPLHSATSTDI